MGCSASSPSRTAPSCLGAPIRPTPKARRPSPYAAIAAVRIHPRLTAGDSLSEVHTAGKTLAAFLARGLIDRDALRPGGLDLRRRGRTASRSRRPDSSCLRLELRLGRRRDPRRRNTTIGCSPSRCSASRRAGPRALSRTIATRVLERSSGEDQPRPRAAVRVVLDVGRDVVAREIDEVEPVEHCHDDSTAPNIVRRGECPRRAHESRGSGCSGFSTRGTVALGQDPRDAAAAARGRARAPRRAGESGLGVGHS